MLPGNARAPEPDLKRYYDIPVPENVKVFVHEEDGAIARLVLPRSKRLIEAEIAGASRGYEIGCVD